MRLPLTCTVHETHPEVMQRPALRQDCQCLIHVAHRRPSKVLIIAHKERRELGPPVQSQSQSGALILKQGSWAFSIVPQLQSTDLWSSCSYTL